jgi:hypothetical protein
MENGSDGKIKKPFVFMNRSLSHRPENGMTLFLQVVKETLSFVIHPIPDI